MDMRARISNNDYTNSNISYLFDKVSHPIYSIQIQAKPRTETFSIKRREASIKEIL